MDNEKLLTDDELEKMRKLEYWLVPSNAELLVEWGAEGLTDKQFASRIGISERTLYRWKKRSKYFRERLQEGKDYFDSERVERALMKIALGYKYEETTESEDGLVVHIREKHPDIKAIDKWLSNRNPSRWRDEQNINIESKGQSTINLGNVSDEALLKLIGDDDDDDE